MLYGLFIILIGAVVAYFGQRLSPAPLDVILLIVGLLIALFGVYYVITSIATPTANDYDGMRAVIGW